MGPSWSWRPMRHALLLLEEVVEVEVDLDKREDLVVTELESPTALCGTEGGASQSINSPRQAGYVLCEGGIWGFIMAGSKGLSFPPHVTTISP